MSVIAAAINDLDGYNAVAVTTAPADGLYQVGRDTNGGIGGTQTFAEMGAEPPGIAGVDASGGLEEDIVFQLAGVNGSEVIRFEAGTSGSQMVEGIQMARDVTGVTAAYDGATGVLTFSAVDRGAEDYVGINMLEGGAGTTFMNDLSAYRANGTDTDAKINGVTAGSRGNEIWLRQSTLDLNMIVEPDTIGDFTFTITGGGALLQLGAVVESAQQVRIGIPGINSGSLGGISGWLYEVVSGGGADLGADPSKAYKIIEEAINQVASIEGQFGAIQRTLINPKIETLSDSVVNLTEMESSIRDADFAKETAALTRSQILIEAGTQILTVANKNPEQVLQLLR